MPVEQKLKEAIQIAKVLMVAEKKTITEETMAADNQK